MRPPVRFATRFATSLALTPKPAFSKTQNQGRTRRSPVFLPAEIICVALGKVGPLLRQIIQREDGGNGTHRNAGAAIDAFHRIDVDHVVFGEVRRLFFGVNAIYRASVNTRGVFGPDTRFSNYVSHVSPLRKVSFHYIGRPCSTSRPYNGLDDSEGPQSRLPRRWFGYSISSRHQSAAQGDAAAGGQTADSIRRGRSHPLRRSEHDHRHRARQDGD